MFDAGSGFYHPLLMLVFSRTKHTSHTHVSGPEGMSIGTNLEIKLKEMHCFCFYYKNGDENNESS